MSYFVDTEMSYFNIHCLLGESGDILVSNVQFDEHFSNLNSEVTGDYHRLIDLPIAIDVILTYNGSLLLVTREGELMVVDNNHPNGVILELGLPPLQKIYKSIPFSVLDIEGVFQFIDIIRFIEHNIPDFDIEQLNFSFGLGDRTKPDISFDNVEWIIPYYQNMRVTRMIIKTSSKLLNLSTVGGVRYGLMENMDPTPIGNFYCFYFNGFKIASNGINTLRIEENVIDLMKSGFARYFIMSEGSLVLEGGISRAKRPDFIPVRLLQDSRSETVYVEDSGGNLYDMNRVMINDNPVESLNLPVVLQGFKRVGMRTKRANRLN